ncbi:MAG: hypothetical protein C4523_07285 [Myxococcales bacterium]|nr:MAG: hypothetical protein C4523_07285 [Myxococcales bacterium]
MRLVRVALVAMLLAFVAAPAFAAVCPKNPAIGSECTFNGWDFTLIDPVEIPLVATCRAKSEHLYVFVENSLSNAITDQRLETFLDAVENAAPNGEGGIFPQVVAEFGPPPDVFDDDPILYLVIHRIDDTTLFPVTAYFRDVDVGKTAFNEPLEGSNQHEVIFLHHENLESDERLSDFARVLVDLVHWQYDPEEEPWVRDVVGRRAALMTGLEAYKLDIPRFAQDPDFPLVGKNDGDRITLDHGASTLFGIYLFERLGDGFVSSWIYDALHGVAGFEHTLPLSGDTTHTFCDYLHDWVVKNGVNRGEYAYSTYELPRFNIPIIRRHPGQSNPTLYGYAGSWVEIDALGFDPANTLEVSYQIADTTGVRLTTVKFHAERPAELIVEELTVAAGQPSVFVFDDAGEAWTTLTLVSSRCADVAPMAYSVKTSVIEPSLDGDEDLEPEIEEEDGDFDEVEPEPEAEPEGESDPDSTLYGALRCPDIHACYLDCSSRACQQACIQNGTPRGQEDWEKYQACITGHNPDGKDCLALDNAEDRKTCIIRNCHLEEEACRVEETPTADNDDVGGSSCQATGGAGALALTFSLLAFARRRRG